MTGFAELVAASSFSFREGASQPQEMVAAAHALGLHALGIADRNTLAGVVRAHVEARKLGLRLIVGARLVTRDNMHIVCHPTDRAAYGRLSRLLTVGNGRARKGDCHIDFEEIVAASEGQVLLVIPPPSETPLFLERLHRLGRVAPGRAYLVARHVYGGDEVARFAELEELASKARTPLIASTDALYHAEERRPLADVLTCIREKCTIQTAGLRLAANGERRLKSADEMLYLFRRHREAVERTVEVAALCRFSLDQLSYEYPDEPVPAGWKADSYLRHMVFKGARRKLSPDSIRKHVGTIITELRLIRQRSYAHYFLTVYDTVRFAVGKGILTQGRGSAANSIVCFCLGITAVHPDETTLLFARFISTSRNEPPDIDVDFEHERREEVIQHLYERYGRHRAALCATVIHYRPRSAIRDVGKAMGLTEDVTATLADTVWGSWGGKICEAHVAQAGLDPANPDLAQTMALADQLMGFPRHLSQHVGGFILTRERLDDTVPILNAAMPHRTCIEWDKDDIDALHIMKVDVLALGMLTCIRRSFEFLRTHKKEADFNTISDVPRDKPEVYAMLQKADSLGVFQVESRAQMSMLPRLKPENFYDLVVEVAIVRPGPIQGGMVHPYLQRRDNPELVEYPSPALKEVLKRTLGVPLFQEQAMQIAIVGAGFTDAEADQLRRAMATFRHTGQVVHFRQRFIAGMLHNDYPLEFAERCFDQIEGFGEYGFPESHAASFAILVYASAWIKCFHPDVFCAAILNSQPMGFYQPAQLVRDARDHGVEIRPADVNYSDWDCTLEPKCDGTHAVRLGLRLVQGANEKKITEKLMKQRGRGYENPHNLWRRSGLELEMLERLAEGDSFGSMGLDRRAALWAVKGLRRIDQTLLAATGTDGDLFSTEARVALPSTPLPEQVAEDYTATGLSLKAHPLLFFRRALTERHVITATQHREKRRAGRQVQVAGLVLTRQRPGTANGVMFLTLEDETGPVNVIVWKALFEMQRRIAMGARFLLVRGKLQRAGDVIHVVAEELEDLSPHLAKLRDDDNAELRVRSRDFH